MERRVRPVREWYLDSRGWGDLPEGTALFWAVPYQELQSRGLSRRARSTAPDSARVTHRARSPGRARMAGERSRDPITLRRRSITSRGSFIHATDFSAFDALFIGGVVTACKPSEVDTIDVGPDGGCAVHQRGARHRRLVRPRLPVCRPRREQLRVPGHVPQQPAVVGRSDGVVAHPVQGGAAGSRHFRIFLDDTLSGGRLHRVEGLDGVARVGAQLHVPAVGQRSVERHRQDAAHGHRRDRALIPARRWRSA